MYICVYTYTYTHTPHTHMHTMEYYLVIKKNEILPFATIWMELEGIMLSEVSQSEKTDNHVFIHVEFEKLKTMGEGKGENSYKQKEANHKKRLNTQNKLRVDRAWG